MAIKYIFFDCFNTLVDDFDESGDESGMKPLAHIPVKHQFYEEATHFHQDYLTWRRTYWSGGNHDEVLLADRLHSIFDLARRKAGRELDVTPVLTEMMHVFYQVYPETLRKSPMVHQVLGTLKGKIPMGVVSNFFLPGYPEEILKSHDLHHYFNFIIDSAQVMVKKPGREIYFSAMQKAGLQEDQFNEVLFIGDHLKNDVLMPHELGMQAWYFDRSTERPGQESPAGITSFKSWGELASLIKAELGLGN